MSCPTTAYANTRIPVGGQTLSAGQTLDIQCADGYGSSVMCTSNFSVMCGPTCDFPNTTCVPVSCDIKPVLSGVGFNGLVTSKLSLDPNGPGFKYGETVSIACSEGYTIDASTQVAAVATCAMECKFDKSSCVKVRSSAEQRKSV